MRRVWPLDRLCGPWKIKSLDLKCDSGIERRAVVISLALFRACTFQDRHKARLNETKRMTENPL